MLRKTAIFIPAYNEERSIGSTILLARAYGEVHVIDDGSSDRTAQIARSAGAIVHSHKKNLGYGAAVRAAFSIARQLPALKALVLMDADFQHNPADIPRVAAPVLSGSADVCIGSRFGRGNGIVNGFENAPAFRRHGVSVLNILAGAANGKKALDFQSGFRAFSGKAIRAISFRENGYSAGAEIISSAQQAGLRIVEVPVSVRYFDKDKNALSQAAGIFEFIVRQILGRNPLFFFGAAGAAALSISAVLGAFVVETFYTKGVLPTGTALLTIFSGTIGAILLSIAINLYALRLELAGKKSDG